jgi:hypothetical protein
VGGWTWRWVKRTKLAAGVPGNNANSTTVSSSQRPLATDPDETALFELFQRVGAQCCGEAMGCSMSEIIIELKWFVAGVASGHPRLCPWDRCDRRTSLQAPMGLSSEMGAHWLLHLLSRNSGLDRPQSGNVSN